VLFEFEVHGEKLVSRRMHRLADRVVDFSPAFEKVADDLRASEQRLFDSEGASSGGLAAAQNGGRRSATQQLA
jgi:hypothetical protein